MAFGGAGERPGFGLVEQTDAQRAAAERRRTAAAAAAAGVAAAPSPAVGEVPAAGLRAAAVGSILAALVAFLAAQRARMRGWLRERLRRRAPSAPESEIDRLLSEEEGRQAEFERRQAERFARDLTTALAIPDPAAREAAVRGLTKREQRYARQRDEAMAARAFAAVDRVVLRAQSPQGAFWKLDPTVIEHTAGCLIMGGKFWPWAVLERVHPPRHHGCPCRLLGYGEAVADGLLAPGAVVDVGTAIRRAAAVVMEGALLLPDRADADALIEEAGGRELMGARSALLAAGLVADEAVLDELLTEAFDPEQARWPKGHPSAGQWRPKIAAGVGGKRSAPGWLARDFDELRALVAPKRVGARYIGNMEVPIMEGPRGTAELSRVGASVAKLAERYGTWRADRARIIELHAERRALAGVQGDRIDKAGGHQSFVDREHADAKRETRDVDPRRPFELMDGLRPPAEAERMRAIDGEVTRLLRSETRGKREALLAVLAQVRPMGGAPRVLGYEVELADGGAEQAPAEELRAAAARVARYFPADWWGDVNAKGGITLRESDQRAWHRLVAAPADAGRPGQRDSLIRVRPEDEDIVLHELAHRHEQVYGDPGISGIPPILRTTLAFLAERTRDEPTRPLFELYPDSGYEEHEKAWADEFVDAYIGRDYGTRATEVLTMGMQMVFFPRYGREFEPSAWSDRKGDLAMRDFVLGMLGAM